MLPWFLFAGAVARWRGGALAQGAPARSPDDQGMIPKEPRQGWLCPHGGRRQGQPGPAPAAHGVLDRRGGRSPIRCTDEDGVLDGELENYNEITYHYHHVSPEESVVAVGVMTRDK